MNRSSIWIFRLGIATTVIIWGINFPVVKYALAEMPPVVLNAFRMSISVGLLGAIYLRRRSRRPGLDPVALLKTHGWKIAGLGVLGHVIYQLGFIYGVHHTSSGNAALIMAFAPFWTALLGQFAATERMGRIAWGGLMATVVGTGTVVASGSSGGGISTVSLRGDLIMVGASIAWGTHVGLSKPFLERFSALGLTVLTMSVAPPVFWALAVPQLGDVAWAAIGWRVWGAIVFSGAGSVGLAYVIWNRSIQRVGASYTSALGNLVPLVAIVGGYLLLGEPILWSQIGGGGLIIGGLLTMDLGRPSPDSSVDSSAAETATGRGE